MKKIITLTIVSVLFSIRSIAQNEIPQPTSFISVQAMVKAGDYDSERFFLSSKAGFEIKDNSWFGLNLAFDKQKQSTYFNDYSSITSESRTLGVGAFYRKKYAVADKFYFSNDVEANVIFNLEDTKDKKPLQLVISLDAEYNPTPQFGLRLGLGHLSFVSYASSSFIDINYLFSSPSMSLLFYF